MSRQEQRQQRGVQSVEVASKLLDALLSFGQPASLKEIAGAVEMSSARAFPYLVSLLRTGLVTKDEASGLYSLGQLSQELGILGLHYLSPLDEAQVVVRALAEATGHTVALSVWGAMGPTVVRVEASRFSLLSEIRLGSVMSLVNTSLGRVFAAWMPSVIVEGALNQEVLRAGGAELDPVDRQRFFESLESIRKQGMDVFRDTPRPGLSGLNVPVFGFNGEIAFVLTLFDETQAIDLSLDGGTAEALVRKAGELSRQLGYCD